MIKSIPETFTVSTCNDFIIRIEGDSGFIHINMANKGCEGKLFCQFGNNYVYGHKKNFTAFTLTMSDWNKVALKVTDMKVYISLNDTLVYQDDVIKGIYDIVQLKFLIKATGFVDYVYMKDLQTANTYIENFDSRE